MTSQIQYFSTAIPFVNARPHLGFALELVITDALARHARARGQHVRFVTGTDDHSLKNVLAAEREGIATERLVERNVAQFTQLTAALDISCDTFVSTSRHPPHPAAVHALWRACAARGDLYRQRYSGLYCVGCERFAERGETQCDEHPAAALEPITEDNWFFRLSGYRDQLNAAIQGGALRIAPAAAREETLAWLREPLPDVCVSRTASRARGWGLGVPDDPDQVIWVWFDALTYYLSALDFGGKGPSAPAFERFWRSAERRVHVIGKGITRFHALLWPAILASAGLPWPTDLLVHGYLTIDGAKISKSGHGLDPLPLIEQLGPDAVRYYLLRHIRTTRDGDFSRERLLQAYTSELVNGLGNLVDRCLGLVARTHSGRVPQIRCELPEAQALHALASALPAQVNDALAGFALDAALDAVFAVVATENRFLDRTAPWALIKRGEHDAASAVLGTALAVLRELAQVLLPFLPQTAARLLETFDAERAGRPLPRSLHLFPRCDPGVWGITLNH